MYLPLDAVKDALRQLTSLAAEGSVLAMTYRVPDRLPFGAIGRVAIPALFAAAGEPLKSTLEPTQLASALASEWEVTYDENARGWKALSSSGARVPSSEPHRSPSGSRETSVLRRSRAYRYEDARGIQKPHDFRKRQTARSAKNAGFSAGRAAHGV